LRMATVFITPVRVAGGSTSETGLVVLCGGVFAVNKPRLARDQAIAACDGVSIEINGIDWLDWLGNAAIPLPPFDYTHIDTTPAQGLPQHFADVPCALTLPSSTLVQEVTVTLDGPSPQS
jgi:hypothetical protein